MSSFTGFNAPLELRYYRDSDREGNRDYWKLMTGFEYYLATDVTVTVKVPKGFVTDGASVPKWLQWLLPPWGAYGQAAVLHDYLLDVGRMRNDKGHFVYCRTRTEARKHFIDAMRILSVPRWKRYILGVGVWLFDKFKEDKLR